MPWLRSVAARDSTPSPRPSWSCTPSRPRIASGGTSGTASRTTHGTSVNGCSGSSRVKPQSMSAKGIDGATRVRAPPALSFSQSAASVQCEGTSSYAPVGASRALQAGAVAPATTTSTSMATTADGCFSGCSHFSRMDVFSAPVSVPVPSPAAVSVSFRKPRPDPGHGSIAVACANPSISGRRSAGSILCRFLSGASGPSRSSCPNSPRGANGVVHAVMVASPTSAMSSQPRRPGIEPMARPTRPIAATAMVARIRTGSETSALPPTRSSDTNGAHDVAPRSASPRLSQRVVTPEDSM